MGDSLTYLDNLSPGVRSLREDLKPRPCRSDREIATTIRQSQGPRVS